MKVLVTGGAGYIGSHVAKHLADQDHDVLVFDDFSTGHREFADSKRLFEGTLSDYGQIDRCVKLFGPDAVMHFAAKALVGEGEALPLSYYRANVMNSINLFSAAIENGCRHVVFSSSAATYGMPKKTPIKETAAKEPINTYGKTKLMIEDVLRDLGEKGLCRYVILRYFNAAGASSKFGIGEWHVPETHLIPNILTSLVDGTEVKVFGDDYPTPDGTCVRDYIHVDDLAEGHALALEHIAKGGESEVLNLGSERGFSIMEIIKEVGRVTGRKVRFKVAPRRPGDPPVLVADSHRAGRILKWKATRSLSDILSSAWKWHARIEGKGLQK